MTTSATAQFFTSDRFSSSQRSSGPGVYRRIVCCQGASQLASAIASMRELAKHTIDRTRQGQVIENHFLVHDLYCPDAGQTQEFYHSLQYLATQVAQWQSCTYLGPDEVIAFNNNPAEESPLEALRTYLALPECDELYLSQNSVLLYDMLRQAYPQASCVCFGDGVGLNFSRNYLCFRSPETPFPEKYHLKTDQSLMRTLVNRSGEVVAPAHMSGLQVEEHSFDQFCLLLPNLFDQLLDDFQQLTSACFIELFARFAESFEVKAPATHAALSKLNSRSGTSVILLSSYFSESGMMPCDVELKGYIELLSRLPQGTNVDLIIKPHPRDSYEKLSRLQALTASHYRQTLALSDPWTFYLPIESLFAKYFLVKRWRYPRRQVHVAAVGTSCITLEYLYGQRCELGFKSATILEECSPEWRKLRSIHEYDLARILIYVRKLRKIQHRKHLLNLLWNRLFCRG